MNFLILILFTVISVASARASTVEYFNNGVSTTVKVDSVTPANSKPLPVRLLNASGGIYNLATEATLLTTNTKLDTVNTNLGTINTSVGTVNTTLGLTNNKLDTIKADTAGILVQALDLVTIGNASNVLLTNIDAGTPAALGQTTMSASQPVTIASDQTTLATMQAPAVISAANSSTANLGIAGVFTGTGVDVLAYPAISVAVFANQVSGTLGLSLQQSSDNTNWDIIDAYTIPASTGKTFTIASTARYFRVVYTNGGVAQTVFRLQTILHTQPVKGSTHSLVDVLTLQNDAELVTAQMRATNGTNSVAVTADASSNLNVNLAASTVANFGAATTALRTASIIGNASAVADFNAGAVSAQTLRVVAASNSPAPAVPTAVTVKQATISVGTSAVRLTTDAAAPSATRRRLNFMLNDASTAQCYVGSATVTTTSTTRGLLIYPGATQEYVDDANDYYLICSVAAQDVFVLEAE